jgi:hypothetical protein
MAAEAGKSPARFADTLELGNRREAARAGISVEEIPSLLTRPTASPDDDAEPHRHVFAVIRHLRRRSHC